MAMTGKPPRRQTDRLAAAIGEREAAFAGKLYTPEGVVAEALLLARHATGPSSPTSRTSATAGTSDTVGALRALLRSAPKGR